VVFVTCNELSLRFTVVHQETGSHTQMCSQCTSPPSDLQAKLSNKALSAIITVVVGWLDAVGWLVAREDGGNDVSVVLHSSTMLRSHSNQSTLRGATNFIVICSGLSLAHAFLDMPVRTLHPFYDKVPPVSIPVAVHLPAIPGARLCSLLLKISCQ
jgi:hypothetical protein